jgi:hypothetical protein
MTLPIGTAEWIFSLFSFIDFFQAMSPATGWEGRHKPNSII